MPLVVVCGKPCSGKSTLTRYFCGLVATKTSVQVEVVSDDRNAAFTRSIYKDFRKEREHRAFLKSEVQRLLSQNCLVICDSLNYIKGFRYELFCIAKLVQTTYCVLYCDASEHMCTQLNIEKDRAERYEAGDMSALIMRFEEPDSANRWDSPLFKIEVGKGSGNHRRHSANFEEHFSRLRLDEKKSPLEEMYLSLFKGRNLSANASTEIETIMPPNFLHALDHITKDVITSVLRQQRNAIPGDTFFAPYCTSDDEKVLFTRCRSFAELSGLRRQFINSMRMHPSNDTSKFAPLFVNYLNSNP
ncbi:unnamed protein product [Litomosoides sigmodontis]|uniref:Protein KTI12 homolog n=1 Tax=Litomosoides sigmodontis TaxID=42156 RepID=A0A3P7JJX7_LITSI|nr:unnamed protein product [Litomosoides sigmodontis]